MKAILLLSIVFVVGFNQALAADSCKDTLLSLLSTAKNKVNEKLEKGSNCHNAAFIGRQNGKPGCFPPALNTLMNTLTPIFDQAKAVCNKQCAAEGKKEVCLEATNKNKLRDVGIEGIIDWIKKNADFSKASFKQEPTPEPAAPSEI